MIGDYHNAHHLAETQASLKSGIKDLGVYNDPLSYTPCKKFTGDMSIF